jgi:hypothetical protein
MNQNFAACGGRRELYHVTAVLLQPSADEDPLLLSCVERMNIATTTLYISPSRSMATNESLFIIHPADNYFCQCCCVCVLCCA